MSRFWLLLVVLLGVALLCGCTRVEQAPPTPAQGPAAAGGPVTEVVLFTYTPPDEEAANLELIKRFEQSHPNLKVRLQNESGGSQNAMTKLQMMISGQTGPDVMAIHGAFFIPFAAKGALLDLQPKAAAEVSDFSDGILSICKYEGKLYSLPRYTSVYATFYNKTLFDEANVAYPGSGASWTWADYLKTTQALTKDTNGDGKPDQWGCVIDFWGARMYPWLWQNGASLMNEDRSQCVLDSPAAIEALQFVYDLRTKHKVAAASDNAEQNAALNAFTQGKIGMYMTGPWDIQLLRETKGLQWDVAPLPQQKEAATLLGTENYAVWSGTKHPDEAWELFKYLLSPEAQVFMAEKLEKMPSRTSVLNGAYAQAQTDHNRKVFADALAYARAPENIPEWSQVKDLIQNELDLIWVGKKSVQAGLKKAAAEVNATLKKLRGK
jgi:ABC-type glycerol-3-phosphate transport system substrate-binding protein